jgi:hypothetical protein
MYVVFSFFPLFSDLIFLGISQDSRWRARLGHFLHQPKFHYGIIGLVIFDMVVVFIDLVLSLLSLPCLTEEQLEWFHEHHIGELPPTPNCKLPETPALIAVEWFLFSLSVVLLSVFVLELMLSGFAFGLRHFKKPIYAIDAAVVVTSLVLEIYFKFGDGGQLETAPSAIITLRLWKIVRAIHAIVHSIELKNREIIKAVKTAKDQVEETLNDMQSALETEKAVVGYLREQASHMKTEDVKTYVDSLRRGSMSDASTDSQSTKHGSDSVNFKDN